MDASLHAAQESDESCQRLMKIGGAYGSYLVPSSGVWKQGVSLQDDPTRSMT